MEGGKIDRSTSRLDRFKRIAYKYNLEWTSPEFNQGAQRSLRKEVKMDKAMEREAEMLDLDTKMALEINHRNEISRTVNATKLN